MKKLTLAAVMAGLLALVANSYAEVQQVRIAGDIRLRAYLTDGPANSDGDDYANQRTRLSVEADLEDHVMLVVTLAAQSTWGDGVKFPTGLGAATRGASTSVDLVEAYVRFQELFWSPLSLQLGRQALNYGHGLIFSNNENELYFDAARFVYDMADKGLAFDLVYIKQTRTAVGPAVDGETWFLNARYDGKNMVKNVEVYFGDNIAAVTKTTTMMFGIRGDLVPMENWKVWVEFNYEFGSSAASNDLGAWMFDVGTAYTFSNVQWKPTAWFGFFYASSGTNVNDRWVQWFDYNVRGGMVLSPTLANMQILSFGIDTDATQKWTFGLHGFWYTKSENTVGTTQSGADNSALLGGLVTGSTPSDELGFEFNAIVGFNYSKDVKTTFGFGYFAVGDAFGAAAEDVLEFRGEVSVSF